jgi:C-terminal processing protease CtpA/Prc
MLYSYTIIADLEASRTALSLFGESVLQDLRFVYSELACSADMQEKCGILEKRLETSERESAAEIARLIEKNHMLEERNRVLEKRTQTSERESAAEIARLNAEIHRLKSLLNQQQQAPKLVGIGMRITNDPPHRVTEIVAGGAAYQSGEIAVGDYILQVGNMDIRHYPIEQILKNILGPAGSYLDLRLDRRDENEESNVFTVTIKRSEIVPTGSQLYQRVCALAYSRGLCTTKRLLAHVHMLSSV